MFFAPVRPLIISTFQESFWRCFYEEKKELFGVKYESLIY